MKPSQSVGIPTQSERRPRRVLKLVLGLDCANACSYCALKGAHGFGEARGARLDPQIAEPRIRQVMDKYEITGLEVGAGEIFDFPDLWKWLLDFNARELKVPVMAFTSGLSRHTPRVLDALAASGVPVLLLVSYDGRRSERNALNWREAEAAFRRMRTRLPQASNITLKLSACVTPKDTQHLKENFLSLLELQNAPFAFRPIKRAFSKNQREAFVSQLATFIEEAAGGGVRLVEAPVGDSWALQLKRDWTCHKLGISLLPDGRFTDCYVAWYCSNFNPERTLPFLDGLDRFFTDAEAPVAPLCGQCLDIFDLCNLCPAGLADFQRATGQPFYSPEFCRMVNRASLLLLNKALEPHPRLEMIVKRGPVETRIRREAGRLVLTFPHGTPPVTIDPRDPSVTWMEGARVDPFGATL